MHCITNWKHTDMKKLLFSFVALLVIGCTSKYDKMCDNIQKDIKGGIPSHWVYTPGEFTIVKDLMSSVYDTEEYKNIYEKKLVYDSVFVADSILFLSSSTISKGSPNHIIEKYPFGCA